MIATQDRARTLLAVGLAAVLFVLLAIANGALTPFIIGLALAYVLAGPVELLARRLPRWLALLIVLVGFLVVLGLALRFLVPAIAGQLATFGERLPMFLSNAQVQLDRAGLWWGELGVPDDVRRTVESSLQDALRELAGAVQDALVTVALGILRALGFLFGLLVIPFWVFYVLRDRPKIQAYIRRRSGDRREDVVGVMRIAERVLGGWVRAQVVLMITVGVATALGTFALGSFVSPTLRQFALVLGVIAAITELVPVIGPIIGAIPAVLLALTDNPISALWVILLYVVIQQLENAVLVPKIVGDALQLHPAVLIVALVVGGAVFGLVGAILAAPLVAFTRSLYRYTDSRLRGVPPREALEISDPGHDPEARSPSPPATVPASDASSTEA